MTDEHFTLPDGSHSSEWAPTGRPPKPYQPSRKASLIVAVILLAPMWAMNIGFGIHAYRFLELKSANTTAVAAARVTSYSLHRGASAQYVFDTPASASSVTGAGDIEYNEAHALVYGNTRTVDVVYLRDSPSTNAPRNFVRFESIYDELGAIGFCLFTLMMTGVLLQAPRKKTIAEPEHA